MSTLEAQPTRPTGLAVGVALGIMTGLVMLIVGDAAMRWLAFSVVLMLAFLAWTVIKDRRAALGTMFVFTLQAEMAIRLLYGHGKTPGVELYLSALAAAALYLWMRGSGEVIEGFGALRQPIILLLATTCVSAVVSSDHFASFARVLFELQLFLTYVV